jgi:hypothetical protein
VEERVRGEASGGSSEIGQWGRFGRKKRGGGTQLGNLGTDKRRGGFSWILELDTWCVC